MGDGVLDASRHAGIKIGEKMARMSQESVGEVLAVSSHFVVQLCQLCLKFGDQPRGVIHRYFNRVGLQPGWSGVDKEANRV